MAKTLSMASHKNYNLGVSEGSVIFFTPYLYIFNNYMLYWRFHFDNKIPVNCLFTQWKWTCILDFGPWRWSALNKGFVDKWPSRMQGQWFLWSRAGGQQFLVRFKKFRFYGQTVALARIYLPQKVRGGRFNVPRKRLVWQTFKWLFFSTNHFSYKTPWLTYPNIALALKL